MADRILCTEAIKASFTPEDLELLQHVNRSTYRVENQTVFTTGGLIEAKGENYSVFYKTSDGQGRFLDLPASVEAINELHENSVQSPHGKGDETVLDESYRLARELKTDRFGLNFDPISQIALQLEARYSDKGQQLSIQLSKLNIYAKGGFFKPHRDTSRGRGHIGSIVMCLPSDFTGGELVVRKSGRTKTFDWSKICAEGWAFLYSDCEHEVLPVISGARLTLAYDVFARTVPELSDSESSEDEEGLNDSELYTGLDALMQSISKTHSKKITFAFGTFYDYPNWGGIEKILKGSDKVVYRVAKKLGLKCDLAFVLENDEEEYEEYFYEYFDEAEWPTPDEIKNSYFISPKNGAGLVDAYVDCHIYETANVELRRDLVWISGPKRSWQAGDYVAYGNEAQVRQVYVSGVILIEYPGSSESQ